MKTILKKKAIGEYITDIIQQDFKKGLSWLTKAAEQKHAEAQYMLGKMYELGHGVPHDKQQAIYWYTAAAKGKHNNARYKLGLIYEQGWGTDKNTDEAVRLLKQAGNTGHYEAQNKLRRDYGIETNRRKKIMAWKLKKWKEQAAARRQQKDD